MTRTTLKAQSEKLAQRKAELRLTGRDYVLANSGGRRTPEKRALLAKLREIASANPRAFKFKANF